MTIGNRIKEVREKAGLSQVDLADKVGVTKQSLYKYENDIVTNIPSDKIEAIAKVCHSTPEYIMGWSESESALMELAKETVAQKEFLNLFEQLNEADKKDILDYMNFKLSGEKYKKESISVS